VQNIKKLLVLESAVCPIVAGVCAPIVEKIEAKKSVLVCIFEMYAVAVFCKVLDTPSGSHTSVLPKV
jgi:hypothetical protein